MEQTPIFVETLKDHPDLELGAPPTLEDALRVLPHNLVAKAHIVIFDGYIVKDRPGDTTVVPGVGVGRARLYDVDKLGRGILTYDEPID